MCIRDSFDGGVYYFGKIFNELTSQHFYHALRSNTQWEHDEVFLFGKRIVTKRKVAWYGSEPFDYTYSKSTKKALSFNPVLLEILASIENITYTSYNSCLLNLYHKGDEGMSWHSDDEKELLPNGAIASLSFGSNRKFVFKHKDTKEKVEVWLENGSLLLMKGETQKHWLHSLPVTKKVNAPRINLTFRTIVQNQKSYF